MTADHQPKRLGWTTCPDCGGDAHDMSDDTVECLKCGYKGDGSEIPFDLDDQPTPSPPVTADTTRPAGQDDEYGRSPDAIDQEPRDKTR